MDFTMHQTPPLLEPHHAVASEALQDLVPHEGSSRVYIGNILSVLGDRAWGVAVLALALPCLVPMPIPGIGLIFGGPLLLLSVQLAAGQSRLWLPHVLRRQSVSVEAWQKMLAVFLPRLRQIERVLHHRLPWVSSPVGERITGFMMVLVSLILLLPLPFTNIPLGTILCLLGLGLFERDGLVLLVSWALSILSFGLFLGAVLFGGSAFFSFFA